MNKLFGKFVYLGGQIEDTADGGVGWRREITPVVEKMGLIVYDPTKKPPNYPDNEVEFVEKIRGRGLTEEERKEGNQKIVWPDFAMVNLSNFGIFKLDFNRHSCGSYREIFRMEDQKKPVLIAYEGNPPSWVSLEVPSRYFFRSMDQLIVYLIQVDLGKITDDRWNNYLIDTEWLRANFRRLK